MSEARSTDVSRRRFGAIAGGAAASLLLDVACGRVGGNTATYDGRLTARPRANAKTSERPLGPLGLESPRDAILRLPTPLPATPLPLVVLFHGAGGTSNGVLERLGSAPDATGVAVLAPDSRGQTWDAIRGGFGRDVDFIDRALTRVFDQVAIDPARIAAAGFSDGATYAISLGLINGDLFSHVLAFSPGFIVDGTPHGHPRVFVSHGTADPILPIDQCGRPIVRELRKRGYEVTFKEFDGGHEVPLEIARAAMVWMES
jgi:phospholipase/carboxylesterase